MKPIRFSDFVRLEGLKRDYLIPGLVPEAGRIALYGVAKRGKSFLALQLALAVAQGTPFLDIPVKKSGPVLYLQFDTPPELWQERLIKLRDSGVNISGDLYAIHPSTQPRRVNLLHGHQVGEIHDMITATLPVLVIIDVLAKVHSLDENAERDMKPVIDRLSTLCAGRALLIVHHTAKPNLMPGASQQSASTAGRGSSYLGGEVDANWLLKVRQRGTGALEIEARFAAAAEDIKLTQGSNGLWTAVGQNATPDDGAPKLATALSFIHGNRDRGYGECLALATAMGLSESTFKRAWKLDQDAHQPA